MYPVALGTSFEVEQVVSGTGVFDGTDLGRAALTLGAGDAGVVLRARLYGTPGNAYTVTLVDPGAGVTSALSVTQVGSAVTVSLGRTAGGLTSTAAQVAAAINAAVPGLAATSTGTGAGVVAAAAATALAGGLDPVVDPSGTRFGYAYAANLSGGLFYFENDDFLILRDVQAKFPSLGGGVSHVQFLRVHLDQGLNVVAGSGIPVFEADVSAAAPSITLTDVRIPFTPYSALQALFTVGSAGGTIRVIARREARFPYL